MKYLFALSLLLPLSLLASVGDPVDCSSAYQELAKPVACKVIACEEKQREFLGTWEGPFEAFDRKANLSRPLRNQVKYSADECLENIDAGHSGFGDKFIIGRKIDIYPSFQGLPGKTDTGGLLITGKHRDGSLFLRSISPLGDGDKPEETRVDYIQDKKNKDPNLSVWWALFPNAYEEDCKSQAKKCSYDLKFTVSDGKRLSDTANDTRDVTVKMEMFVAGTSNRVMEQITNRGHHTKKK